MRVQNRYGWRLLSSLLILFGVIFFLAEVAKRTPVYELIGIYCFECNFAEANAYVYSYRNVSVLMKQSV